MINVKVQMKSKAQMTKRIEKCFGIESFDIHLTFTCLPVGRGFDI
jgi:hypothetical protein